jgi:hypothetical protein
VTDTPRRPRIATVWDAIQAGTPAGTMQSAGARLSGKAAALRTALWQDTNREHFQRSLKAMERYEQSGGCTMLGTLFAEHITADGHRTDLGLVSCRVVTDTGVAFLVDALQGLVEPELLRFHGLGTGSTAEAATQTALVTELTTQYGTANTRPQGSLGELAGDAKTFETTGTITVSAAAAITEHAIFTQAAAPGGVMFDRSVFGAVNLAASESLAVTYRLTLPSGG